MFTTIILVILAVIVVCGIVRVIITPSEDLGDFLMDILFLDVLGELLSAIVDAIFGIF